MFGFITINDQSKNAVSVSLFWRGVRERRKFEAVSVATVLQAVSSKCSFFQTEDQPTSRMSFFADLLNV